MNKFHFNKYKQDLQNFRAYVDWQEPKEPEETSQELCGAAQ